jgi:hypothetical protein
VSLRSVSAGVARAGSPYFTVWPQTLGESSRGRLVHLSWCISARVPGISRTPSKYGHKFACGIAICRICITFSGQSGHFWSRSSIFVPPATSPCWPGGFPLRLTTTEGRLKSGTPPESHWQPRIGFTGASKKICPSLFSSPTEARPKPWTLDPGPWTLDPGP